MQDFLYDNYTRLLFGKEAEAQLGAQAAEFSKAKKALIVYGSDRVKKDGLLGRSEQALQAQGFETKCLGGVVPNPRLSKVHEGIQMASEMGADFILGVGGGSVMDTAKAIAAGVPYEGDVWDFAIGKAELATALPVGVVATMAATGSESSEWAVITNDENMSKLGIGGGCLRPAFAVLNPELTMTQPAYQTACGCVDIMAHVMDSFFTRTPDCVLTDNMSIALLKTVVEFAPIALKEPNNYHARAELMLTSTLAMSGLVGVDRITCLNAHSLGEDFGGLYDLTHGATLAIVEPALLTYKVEAYLPRLVRFAKEVWGVTGEDDKAVALEGIERMKQFFRSMGVPVTLREVGIDIDKDGRMLAQRIEAFEGGSVYVDLSHEDVYQVYSLAK